ncbi:MAG: hypothetical protein KZQ94_22315 [Candidatus Thiodiazotropha sp. (ex Troendleina suluensis)]|nr:hypothetical protein [Candidatus Thiodiazotropha sp. (ex Troendleina suluensis)]
MTTDQSKKLMDITKKMADELEEYVSLDKQAGFSPSSAEDTLQKWNDFCLEMPSE